MANYLPVLLVSVTAGMPDDAALQPLPRGQVDYLSHDWAEEDVWRSWRSMTKQKHEIANGVRLENASWRTWMKQRNKLKTISPETLNWLKDSDVTWLYGPLHTAVDWSPTPKPALSPTVQQQVKDDASAPSAKTSGTSSLSSPSSSINLDHLNEQSSRYSLPQHEAVVKKPILKHRSIAEMLTSALPPAPVWAEENGEFSIDHNISHHEPRDVFDFHSQHEGRESSSNGHSGRPPLLHTKSDTHVPARFGRGGAHISPPRTAPAETEREPVASSQAHPGSLSANQRTGASNDLAEMAFNARTSVVVPNQSNSLQTSASPYTSTVPLDSTESSASSVQDSGRADTEGGIIPHALAPQKKHISFNAIVEQCIAIDSASAPLSPPTRGQPWTTYDDDGYAEDTEEGPYEDAAAGDDDNSDSEDSQAEAADQDEVIVIKPPSRRLSSSSQQDDRTTLEAHHPHTTHSLPSHHSRHPHFHRSSSGSSKLSRSRHSDSVGSGSGSSSGRASETGRSRSSVALDREHVTIAPIAPTILKTGGVGDNDDGVLYIGGSTYPSCAGTGIVYGSAPHYIHRNSNYGGMHESPSGYGYGYGGYGFGERVSEGRDDAFEHFERGTEGGELVYQSPNGNVYPWGEGDAVRFRMQTGYGEAGSPPRLYGARSRHITSLRRTGAPSSSSNAHCTSGSLLDDPRGDAPADDVEFEYFDDVLANNREATTRSGNGLPESKGQSGTQFLRGGAQSLPERQTEERENRVRMAVACPEGGADCVEQRSPRSSLLDTLRDRTPSPDFHPKVNPRIASLKYESGCRPPSPSFPSSGNSDITSTLAPSSPALAIPTPGISPAHEEDYVRMCSPPESPVLHASLLSPPDMSPRGRSACASPVSGSATSSSIVRSGSRSGSESRSDSRGRSRTRNSSLGSSPDQGEPERGRSRSRSSTSGANSPLGNSNSPQTRYPPIAIGGIGVGLGIGGTLGVHHSGREVRDGRGARLYRKTSEDFIASGTQSEGRGGYGTRGRNREGKRISESLSPPFIGSGTTERSTTSPPSGYYRSIPPSIQRSYSARTLDHGSPAEASHQASSDGDRLFNGSSNAQQAERSATGPLSSNSQDNGSASSGMSSLQGPTSSVPASNGRTLPTCIPEEEEQHARWFPEKASGGKAAPSSTATSAILDEVPRGQASSPNTPLPTACVRDKGRSDGVEDGKTIADRTADFMSSARTLIGNIWNGT